MNLIFRLVTSIPFLRHRIIEKQVTDFNDELKLVDTVNRLISCIHIPNSVALYNNGKLKLDQLESPQAYKLTTEIRQAGRDYHEHRDSIIGNKIIETNPAENLSYLEENRHLKNTIEQLKARIEDKDLIISLLKQGKE